MKNLFAGVGIGKDFRLKKEENLECGGHETSKKDPRVGKRKKSKKKGRKRRRSLLFAGGVKGGRSNQSKGRSSEEGSEKKHPSMVKKRARS